ncbi:MAG: hypothetical protein IJ570_05945 [Prevotella sp.]|nr:hypothetical protein [Prevotella sp.]
MLYNSDHQGHSVFPAPGKALLPLLLVLVLAACRDSEPDDKPARRPVSLAFSISNRSGATRMSSVTTQKDESFRGIAFQYLYPFSTTNVSSSSVSLDRIETQLGRYTDTDATNYYFFDDESVDIPEETRNFLCYCTVGASAEATKFENGSTLCQGLQNGSTLFQGLQGSDDTAKKNVTPAVISFSPEVISTNENDGATGQYLTETAKAKNDLNRFVYPAELFYYTNSPIKTSNESQRENYRLGWDDLLKEYKNETNGVMQSGVVSVAITKPLNYAVGRLEIGLLIGSSTLKDATTPTPKSITLSSTAGSETFPLKGVFVTGQFVQSYDLTPTGDTEYIAYDNTISGISMGAPTDNSNGSRPKYTQTLVLQSKDNANVRFALEFENNSGTAFNSIYGPIAAGAMFYLVGTITPGYDAVNDYTRRAFTKDYVTSGTVTINSLKQAYPYLPDLFNPNLEVSLSLKTSWIQSTTTNVPL